MPLERDAIHLLDANAIAFARVARLRAQAAAHFAAKLQKRCVGCDCEVMTYELI